MGPQETDPTRLAGPKASHATGAPSLRSQNGNIGSIFRTHSAYRPFTPPVHHQGEMKIPKSLPQELRALRQELSLGQSQVERAAGLPPRRLGHIERGLRPPREDELREICRVLGVSLSALKAATDWEPRGPGRPLGDERTRLRNLFGYRAPFRWEAEVSFEGYLASVFREHGPTARALDSRILSRRDRGAIERFLRDFPCGARGEALHVLHLLARNWKPAMISPLELGFADPRVRDFRDRPARPYVGHRPMPALATVRKGFAAIAMPQVPLQGETPHVLDFLIFVRSESTLARGDLEIDGPGHDAARDEQRKQSLGLDTLRFTDAELDCVDFDVEERLREFCLAHGRAHRRRLGATPWPGPDTPDPSGR